MRLYLFPPLLLAAAPAAAQSGTVIPADWELTQDDEAPFGEAGPPLEYVHRYALVVKAYDIDQNGWKDIVLGGLGGALYAVKVHYTDVVNEDWVDIHEETLDFATTTACYDLEVGDVSDDGYLDVVVGRRLQSCGADSVFLNQGCLLYTSPSPRDS